jgi:hypothetical protein
MQRQADGNDCDDFEQPQQRKTISSRSDCALIGFGWI